MPGASAVPLGHLQENAYDPGLDTAPGFPTSRDTLPAGDYIAPALEVILPDAVFPHMVLGDRQSNTWPYLRRHIPHNWYCDGRTASIGFVTRDEASILYNSALPFAGKPALEIGCWRGWSACHLLLGGVTLDIIDPILNDPEFMHSVSESLAAAGVLDRARLIPGYSPDRVHQLAREQPDATKKWSLIFIDGNHEAPGPLLDTVACLQYAADDALILFHDLSSPDVAQGLRHLRDAGWNVTIYMTMQIMAAAWRGNVQPLPHVPDPSINFPIPPHLMEFPISGMPLHVPSAPAHVPAPTPPTPLTAQRLPNGSLLVTFNRPPA